MEKHSRSDNLKLALDYDDWGLLSAAARTLAKGLRVRKDQPKTVKMLDRVAKLVEEIMAAQRSEGSV